MAQISTTVANYQADTIGGIFGVGVLNIYAGEIPADADTLLTLNELLTTHILSGFSISVDGVITANSLPHIAYIEATNKATFARLVADNGIIQLSVGTGTEEVRLDNVDYVQGEYSTLYDLTITQELITSA